MAPESSQQVPSQGGNPLGNPSNPQFLSQGEPGQDTGKDTPPQQTPGNTPEANQGNRVPGDGPGMGATSTGPIDKENPSDEQLTGGRGSDLEDTVQSERTGTTEGSSDDEPRNRMIAENKVDLDAISKSGPDATGNRYGFSYKAADNFARDARQEANRHMEQAAALLKQADNWMDVATEARDAEERSAEEEAKRQEEKRKQDQKMDDLLEQFKRIAERMDNQ